MVRHDERSAVVRVHLATQISQTLPVAEHRLAGGPAHGENHLRPQQLELPMETGNTRRDLIGQGLPILWRTTLDDVRDVHRTPRNFNSLENGIEQLAGLSHEWPAGGVFRGARTLADEHEPRLRIAFARHRVGTMRAEIAAVRGPDPLGHC